MDNGRLKINDHDGIVFCDAYLDDEWTVEDVHALVDEIRNSFSPPVDVILRRTGSYSIASEAQALLATNLPEFKRIIYVVDTPTKRASVAFAIKSYMKSYDVEIADSLEEAVGILNRN